MEEKTKNKYRQTNVNLSLDDYELMKTMMFSEGMFNRSAFVSGLIRQEWARRQKEAAGSNPSGKEME